MWFLNPEGIIYGNEAQEALSDLSLVGNSGLHWLFRDRYGFWFAGWDDLANSNGYGRVDWICGEATRADLEQAYGGVVERKYSDKIRSLKEQMEKEIPAFQESLNR